jgi:hypothetical protein
MWMYPFVVDPGKFSNFYSAGKRALRLCARCALSGLAAYLGWLWKAQGRNALHFFVFHTELGDLARLHKEVLQPLRSEGTKGGNVRVAFYGPYLHETTLGLLLELFAHVRQPDRLSEEGRDCLAGLLGAMASREPPRPLTLYAITGVPGQAFNMQALREFSKLQPLYRLYEGWLEILGPIAPSPH